MIDIFECRPVFMIHIILNWILQISAGIVVMSDYIVKSGPVAHILLNI